MKGVWAIPVLASILILGLIGFPQDVFSELTTTENLITDSSAFDTTPTLGAVGTENLVVYHSRTAGSALGSIFVQSLTAEGAPSGASIIIKRVPMQTAFSCWG